MDSVLPSHQYDDLLAEHSRHVPIASLDPNLTPAAGGHLEAAVTLVWPYSSSSRSAALLLAEPDFRLRRRKGQIRVRFSGPAAQRVAKSGIGIGDRIRLALDGSTWVSDESFVSTPGRSVEGELTFRHRLRLQAQRDGHHVHEIRLNEADTPPSVPIAPQTKSVESTNHINPASTSKSDDRVWSSPVVIRSSTTGSLFFHSPYEPLVEEDGYMSGRGRKRTLFGRRSGEWRYSRATEHATQSTRSSPSSRGLSDTSKVASPLTDQASHTSMHPTTHPNTPRKDITIMDSTEISQNSSALQTDIQLSHNSNAQDVPVLQLRTQSLNVPYPSSALPDIPKTPRSPLLGPIESQEPSLASPIPTTDTDFHQDRVPNVLLSKSRQTLKPESLERSSNAQHQSSAMTTDLGFDGSSMSRVPSDSAICAQSQAVGESRHFFLEKDTQIPSLAPVTIAEDSSHREPPSSEHVSQLNIFTSNSELLQHDMNDNDHIEVAGSASHNETTPNRLRHKDKSGSWKARDVFEEFLIQSPVESHVAASESISIQGTDTILPHRRTDRPDPLQTPTSPSEESRKERDNSFIKEPTPPASQLEPKTQLRGRVVSSHRMDEILDGPFPPSPAPTRSNLEDMVPGSPQGISFNKKVQAHGNQTISPRSEHSRSDREASNFDDQSKSVLAEEQSKDTNLDMKDTVATAPSVARTKSSVRRGSRVRRKSEKVRANEVPDVISPWFESRRSSRRKSRTNEDEIDELKLSPSQRQNILQIKDEPQLAGQGRQTHIKARTDASTVSQTLRTPIAVYQPLNSLEKYLGSSDSQGPTPIDVIGIVTLPTSKPSKSRSGPRDYNTTLHISDASLHPNTVQVQCFRPFSTSLPQAEIGDVVLFRDFVVKTRKHNCFLLSAGTSGWIVWRFTRAHDDVAASFGSEHPVSTSDTILSSISECRGPPVECGQEEQLRATELYQWWFQSLSEGNGQGKVDVNEASKL